MIRRRRHRFSRRFGAGVAVIVTVTAALALAADDGAAERSVGGPPDRPESVSPDVWRVLVDLDRQVADRKDFVASFAQHRYTPLLKKPLESHGRVFAKSGRKLWRTDSPRKTVMLVTDDEVRIHYPDQKVVEVYPIRRRVSQLVGTPQPRLAVIAEHFRIESLPVPDTAKQGGDALHVRLTPLAESLREHIERIELELDTRRAVTRRMSVVNPDGERTVVTFSDVRFDTGVSDQQVALDVPEGTTVKRPGKGGGASGKSDEEE